MTLSRNFTEDLTTSASSALFMSPFLAHRATRLIDPRLQEPYGGNGCSPQGFVPTSLSPARENSLHWSTNTSPGFPLFHAESHISFHRRRRSIFFRITLRQSLYSHLSISPSHNRSYAGSFVSGNLRSHSVLPCSRACMNSSEIATEKLALLNLLEFTKACISGCQSFRINIKAAVLDPPCLT